MDKIHDEFFHHIMAAQKNYREAERALNAAEKKARKARNAELLDFISSQMVFVYTSAGWISRAYELLIKREKSNPRDLHAKLRVAEFYFRHGGDYRSALAKAGQIKLAPKPRELDYDAYFNALALRGQAQLLLGKVRAAASTMKEMAHFVVKHSDKTVFFWDMAFVTQMIQKRLGLRHCHDYLAAIDKTEQVSHDQATTKQMLGKVKLLMTGRTH